MTCPVCSHTLIQESTACAEIAGDCYQHCWLECTNCGWESESVEVINGLPRQWPSLILDM